MYFQSCITEKSSARIRVGHPRWNEYFCVSELVKVQKDSKLNNVNNPLYHLYIRGNTGNSSIIGACKDPSMPQRLMHIEVRPNSDVLDHTIAKCEFVVSDVHYSKSEMRKIHRWLILHRWRLMKNFNALYTYKPDTMSLNMFTYKEIAAMFPEAPWLHRPMVQKARQFLSSKMKLVSPIESVFKTRSL